MLTDHIRFNRIVFRNRVFTAGYLDNAVDAVARYLDDHARSNSPIVYLHAPNHIKTVIGFLGILKSGRTCLLVDPKTGALEYEEMLADTPPAAIMRIDEAPIEFDFAGEIDLTDYRMEPSLVSQLGDVCLMLYTAAEDGYAKAAMLTHANILSNAKAMYEDIRVREDSTTCAMLPYHHLFGIQNGLISPVVGGGSLVIADISDIQNLSTIVDDLLVHNVSHIYSVPLVYYLLSKSSRMHEVCRQAFQLITGGYKLPASLRDRFERKFAAQLYEGYGLTEASPVCTSQSRSRPFAADSMGPALLDYQVGIFDDVGRELPSNEKGEICIRGGNVMKGYFNRPDATQKVLRGGWLHSGDYGKRDNTGNIYFLGLIKKMFNVAGNKIYPEEVRRLMLHHGNVSGVELWSDYDPLTGDRMKAKIRLKNNSNGAGEEFSRWCAGAIGPHKIPQNISFEQE